MLSSTREIAPSCVENVDELIERQEKALTQLETKRTVVRELILKGKALLENPDKPKFLDGHVSRIEMGWDETKDKASSRLDLLVKTKNAWVGYADGLDTIALEFEKAEDEMKKVKKRFNLQSAIEDLERRQKIYNDNKTAIETMYKSIQDNYECMTMTLPDDKKDFVKKEVKAITEKLECVGRFGEKVGKIEEFVGKLSAFDKGLQNINDMIKTEQALLPQGEKVPQDAQDFKDELNRVKEFCLDLQKKVMTECDNFSEDVKYWAEYKTGIKEFKPWLTSAQKKSGDGLSKPQDLDQANALYASCKEFRDSCDKNIKILTAANGAAQKMTSHKDADDEVAELKGCYEKVHAVAEEWMKKVDTLVKEWKLLDSTVTELNSWVAEDRKEGEQQFSLEKMESTLGELKNIFKEKEKLVENL